LIETNITPWRRAVAGDLTSAFDFNHPDAWQGIMLPDTDSFEPNDFVRHSDQGPKPPSKQTMPIQETGVRPARALPYTLYADGHINDVDGSFVIDFSNGGTAAAVFQVRSGHSPVAPRTYTVEGGKSLSDVWAVVSAGASTYDLSVYGPNGFVRGFKGSIGTGGANLETLTAYDEAGNTVTLTITNRSGQTLSVTISNVYSGESTSQLLQAGKSLALQSDVTPTYGWYEFVITVDHDPVFAQRFAGHVENGHDTFTDPLMGGLI
jgi:phospholipase C